MYGDGGVEMIGTTRRVERVGTTRSRRTGLQSRSFGILLQMAIQCDRRHVFGNCFESTDTWCNPLRLTA